MIFCLHVPARVYACMSVCVYVCMYVCMHKSTYIYMYVFYIHIHTYIYTCNIYIIYADIHIQWRELSLRQVILNGVSSEVVWLLIHGGLGDPRSPRGQLSSRIISPFGGELSRRNRCCSESASNCLRFRSLVLMSLGLGLSRRRNPEPPRRKNVE